jgi:hypothetical protein
VLFVFAYSIGHSPLYDHNKKYLKFPPSLILRQVLDPTGWASRAGGCNEGGREKQNNFMLAISRSLGFREIGIYIYIDR